MRRLFLVLGFIFALFPLSFASSDFMCNGSIISEGVSKGEVLAKCGPPSWQENWVEELSERISPIQRYRVYIKVEEWYYNRGPDNFIDILRFENGVLAGIRTGGYGY